jgi:hypothetical protein
MTALQTAQHALMAMVGDVYGNTLTYQQLYIDCREAIFDAYDRLRDKYQKIENIESQESAR